MDRVEIFRCYLQIDFFFSISCISRFWVHRSTTYSSNPKFVQNDAVEGSREFACTPNKMRDENIVLLLCLVLSLFSTKFAEECSFVFQQQHDKIHMKQLSV